MSWRWILGLSLLEEVVELDIVSANSETDSCLLEFVHPIDAIVLTWCRQVLGTAIREITLLAEAERGRTACDSGWKLIDLVLRPM